MIKIGTYVNLKKHKKNKNKKIRESYYEIINIEGEKIFLKNKDGFVKLKDVSLDDTIKIIIKKRIEIFMNKPEEKVLTDYFGQMLIFNSKEEALEYMIETNIHINNEEDMNDMNIYFSELSIKKI